VANEPISTTVHLVEKLRCNLCLEIFEFVPPEVANTKKYDESVLASIIMERCFLGVSMNRSSAFGPISVSKRSDLFANADEKLRPIFELLVDNVANVDQIIFDDTKAKIQPEVKGGSKTAWTSAFIGRGSIVYLIDRDHAGKNFEEIILPKRRNYLGPPIAVSDALPAYEPYKKKSVDIHCLTHARRRFKDSMEDDETFCNEMIDNIGIIYKNEDGAKNLDDFERMRLHQDRSGPIFNNIMEKLQETLDEDGKQKTFLPDSDLGKAIDYWLKDFNKLTEVVRTPGVPLDSNPVERGLKSPIRLRKQAPIFKTVEGAQRVGRMLSLIGTALNLDLNPFPYLIWALKGVDEGKAPYDLTPWAFKESLQMSRKH